LEAFERLNVRVHSSTSCLAGRDVSNDSRAPTAFRSKARTFNLNPLPRHDCDAFDCLARPAIVGGRSHTSLNSLRPNDDTFCTFEMASSGFRLSLQHDADEQQL
jgi:hypothetical protein